uniref:Milton domain-containing protein n=1 Tax=Toxocara canis TaxID=6265 RepID=A0A183VEQ1_TOXCA
LAELVKRSMSIERPRLPSPTSENDPTGSLPVLRVHLDEPTPPPPVSPRAAVNADAENAPVPHLNPLDGNTFNGRRKLSETSIEEGAAYHIWTPHDGMRKSGRRGSGSSATGTLSKTASSDSLAGYEGPKMGEPGKPGTRDLDFSIRRLNIRRLVEREYARFRRERGLSPLCIPFFPPPIPVKKRTSAMLRSTSMQQPNDLLQRLLSGDRSRLLQPWRAVSNVGLLAAIRDGVSQGVLVRSALLHNPPTTPPSTPLMHRRCLNGTAGHLPQPSEKPATTLVDALGLCVPSEASLQMPVISA